jgi:sulfite reductase alpha subunit-like flavoprotein
MDFLLGLILLLLLLLPVVFLILKSASGKGVSVKHTIPLPIYFGSQTGTAERYANQLQDLAKTQNFSPSVLELNTLTIEVLQSLPAILIVCSTQGKGDPPDNTSKFLKMVQTAAKQKEVSLSNLSFAVFGLGSMEYMDTFNRVPKLIREALILLGAVEVHAAMLSDETLDMDTDFREWSTVILDVMKGLKVADSAAVEAALNTKTKFLQVKTNVKEGTPDPTWNYERASEQYLSGRK